ncbi:Trehalose-phosphate phosphatase [Candidatus Glomeribacter gigasporarum BEG34]|uniref:Trehalose 6-phosphate phosphatase n=1 Tax=Candidatus Glomeribacter gigasporarum BEG34 TaxID=1070319 RepID=G2J8K1_9BURK|nr:trehalose-phosphatase [Candidatus Glomeribacter gigasporarum]CCD29098.1 Trehalose-phosphate phosphatase [Candidatus Glomeribacter gigasporarum BEG34]
MPLSLPDSLSARESAFFLDFDGTLAELAETPNDVRLSARARAVLDGLVQASNGAVAVISGRSIEGLDALLAPLKLPLAGVHGAERRAARGAVFRAAADRAPLGWMHQALEETVRAHPGMLLEHKGAALALHFRAAQGDAQKAEQAALRAVERLVAQAADQYTVQRGKRVFEIKPKQADKGRVIAAFLGEPPFAGRIPFFAGDDLTDEAGFEAVNARGGWSVKIGAGETAARARLASVNALLDWLECIVSASFHAGNRSNIK